MSLRMNSGRTYLGARLARRVLTWVAGFAVLLAIVVPVRFALGSRSQSSTRPLVTVKDPGVRGGGPNAGRALGKLSASETTLFNDGLTNFTAVFSVPTAGSSNGGLGPRFNSNQCSSCHIQPAVGGSSPAAPATNPLFAVYQLDGATNTMPSFETMTGPILTARFPFIPNTTTPDGTVHQLFTVTGRRDAVGCNISQPAFSSNNIAYRQPLPTFGDGFLELFDNTTLTANMSAVCAQTSFGICGTPNVNSHDGTIDRLGWKAQWRSLGLAAGEELNVQMGVTDEFFPTELDQTPGCDFNPVPESATNFSQTISEDQFTGDPERMALYMKFLGGPQAVKFSSQAMTGQTEFISIGCAMCHTQAFTTPISSVAALSQVTVNLYSDLLLHHMGPPGNGTGPCLGDNVIQNLAQGDMFRTPPLWGAGKRMFFLHDGRTSDLLAAIQDHSCAGNSQYPASEANVVIANFNALSPTLQQDILDFIRDL